MNKTILIGRLTADPTLRYTQSGKAVASFTLAVNRKFKRDEADFIPIVVFNKPAEACANYLKKGSQVAVEGRIQTRNYENQEGKKVYVTEIVAEEVEFLSKSTGGINQGSQKPKGDDWDKYGREVNIDDIDKADSGEDEIPF